MLLIGRGPAGIVLFADPVEPRREILLSTMESNALIRHTTGRLGEIHGKTKGSAPFSTTARQNVIARL
jgi:hypothetical protein